jgi:hypothetical protein
MPSRPTGPRRPASAGYSGSPLPKKLGIKDHQTLVLLGAPPGWTIDALPDGVRTVRRRGGLRAGDEQVDIVVAFFRDAASLRRAGPEVGRSIGSSSSLWLAWPRRAGGHESDVTEQLLRDVLLPLGLVDVKVAALDADWSGLKFVWRREHRT